MQKLVEQTKKQPSKIRSEIITVTPDMALAFLEKNIRNRKLSRQLVDSYARDIMAHRWHLSGAAITFDRDGNLIDGQHRLRACVKADEAFETLVLYGVEAAAKDVIDTGRKRTATDVLAMEGERWTSQKVGVARWILALKSGASNPHEAGGDKRWTMQEVLEVIRDRPMMGQSIAFCYGTAGAPLVSLSAIHYIATNVMGVGDTANAFATVFKTGQPSKPDCPAHRARERLIRTQLAVEKFGSEQKAVLLIHAWNMFAAGEDCTVFRVPKSAEIRGLDVRKL